MSEKLFIHMLTVTTFFMFYQLHLGLSDQSSFGIFAPIRFVDYNDSYTDFYFDRMVAITFDVPGYAGCTTPTRLITTGVLISTYQVLTSYNPFREYARSPEKISKILVGILRGRVRHKNGKFFYTIHNGRIVCGRQVVFLPDQDIAKDQWHGPDRRHSPLHDLFVIALRTNDTVEFSNLTIDEYKPDRYPFGVVTTFTPGPFLTELAGPNEILNKTFKIGSLGHERPHEFQGCRNLHVTEYDADDNGVVDCDNWIPRNWGFFICISNKKNHMSVGSGAMLISNNKVFGVGSFALFKGAKSVLVFTDVRPYYEHIIISCMWPHHNTSETKHHT